MSRAHLHILDSGGNWSPAKLGANGNLQSGSEDQRATEWTYAAAAGGITDTSDVTLKAKVGVGSSVYLRALQIANKHAAMATEVIVKADSTVIWRGYAPAGGVQISAAFNPPLVADNNTDLIVACVSTGTATLVNAQGYTDVSLAAVAAAITSAEEIFADDGTLLLSDAGATLTLN
jgi:hypothetical protein